MKRRQMYSLYEGFPNALAEAMCCSVPCIATDFHSGAREISDPDMKLIPGVTKTTEATFGILTSLCSGKMYPEGAPLENTEKNLSEAIISLLENHEKNEYYREQSDKRGRMLGIDSVVKTWIELIEKEK